MFRGTPTDRNEQAVGQVGLSIPKWFLLAGATVLFAALLGLWASNGAAGLQFDPVHPTHLLIFITFLLGSAIVFHKPELGLLLLIALVYSNASEVTVRFHGWPSALQALGTLLGLVVLRHWLSKPTQRLRGDVMLILLAAHGFVLLSSSMYAVNPALAYEKFFEHIKCLLIFLLVINLVRSRITLDRAVWTLVIVGGILSTISVYQVMTSSYGWDFGGFGRIKNAQIVGELRQPRITGPFADPNFYAQILIPLVPLMLYRLRDGVSRWGKILGAYALTACLITLVFTYSRGGILALAVVLGLPLIIQRTPMKHCLAGLVLFGIALVMVPQQFEQRLRTLSQFVSDDRSTIANMDSSFQQRVLLMRVAWEIWREHQFLGVGAGNYSEHYQEYAERIGSTVSSYEDFDQRRFAHSLYLEMGAETGLVGMTVFAAILVVVGMKGWHAIRIFRQISDFAAARLITSLLVGLIGYLTTSLFLHAHYLRHFWLLLALVAASAHIAKEIAFKYLPRRAM